MKQLLIAASVLAMTAGVAAADITFSGTAKAGIGKDGGPTASTGSGNGTAYADTAFHAYSTLDLVVTASGQTDSGLSFGASFDATGGNGYTLSDTDGFDTNGGSFGTPTVFVSGSFGKLSFSADNLDFYNTDVTNSGSADVKYAGTFGGVGVGLIADMESKDMAVQLTYSAGNLAVSADYNQDTAATALWDASGTYTMGALAVTLSATNDNNAFATGEAVKVAYSTGAIGAWAKYNTRSGNAGDLATIDVGASYSSGPMSLTAEADDVGTANHTSVHWTVTGSYDLGGGLSLEAGTNYTNDVFVGAKMAF